MKYSNTTLKYVQYIFFIFLFKYIDATVTYDNIIILIWIFVFIEIDNLTLVLLSIHGYQSNISIRYDQAIQFFISLNPNIMKDAFVYDWLMNRKNDEVIMISDIIKLMKQSHALTIILKVLKEELISQFVGINGYQKILRRIQYYNLMNDMQQYKDPPKEGVLSKLKRILITKKPPPYYTEYRNINTDYNLLKAELLYEIRVEFGYGRRLAVSDYPTLRSRPSSCKRNNISSIHIALTPTADVNRLYSVEEEE